MAKINIVVLSICHASYRDCHLLTVNSALKSTYEAANPDHGSAGELIKDLPSSHTASHVAQAGWRPAEVVGNHDQGRPGAPFRTASL